MKRLLLIRKRFEKGLSQKQIGKMAGLSTNTICNVENGKMPHPSSTPKLAKAYGITSVEFALLLFEHGQSEEANIRNS